MGKIKLDADKILENAYFDGKARKFTFKHYCEKLKRAFTDLEDKCGDELTDDKQVRIFTGALETRTYRWPSIISLGLMS